MCQTISWQIAVTSWSFVITMRFPGNQRRQGIVQLLTLCKTQQRVYASVSALPEMLNYPFNEKDFLML